MEIIDHHKLGTLQTMQPISFRNQPVGCTGTIMYQMYGEQKLEIPPKIAGLLCAAIISDTLMFRSPTCTPLDRAAAEELAAKIKGQVVTAKVKGGASGKLYGKVTGKEVAEALAQLAGAPIDKKKIEMETRDIKDAGVFNGKVRLYVGVVASFKIQVEVEQA